MVLDDKLNDGREWFFETWKATELLGDSRMFERRVKRKMAISTEHERLYYTDSQLRDLIQPSRSRMSRDSTMRQLYSLSAISAAILKPKVSLSSSAHPLSAPTIPLSPPIVTPRLAQI